MKKDEIREIRDKLEELMNMGYDEVIWVDNLLKWGNPEKIDSFFFYIIYGIEQNTDPTNVWSTEDKIKKMRNLRNRVIAKYRKQRLA